MHFSCWQIFARSFTGDLLSQRNPLCYVCQKHERVQSLGQCPNQMLLPSVLSLPSSLAVASLNNDSLVYFGAACIFSPSPCGHSPGNTWSGSRNKPENQTYCSISAKRSALLQQCAIVLFEHKPFSKLPKLQKIMLQFEQLSIFNLFQIGVQRILYLLQKICFVR